MLMRQASALRAATPLFVFLTVLSSACGAQEKAAAGAGAGKGWVPLPSGGRLYYEVAGTKGDTIVVPGAVFWESALAPLAQNHTVIFYDLLGRGRSDTASASRIAMDSIVADLETLRPGGSPGARESHCPHGRVSVVVPSTRTHRAD